MACILKLQSYLLAFLLATSITTALAEDAEEPIKVGAPVTAVQQGKDAEIKCSTTLAGNNKLSWYKGEGGQLVPENKSLSVSANYTTGLLTVQNAQLNDTGTYQCQTDGGVHNATAELHVYEMPSYFEEGMIIVGITTGLVLVFIICAVHSFIRNRKPKPPKPAPKKPINTVL
ncbi:hypothetical protein V1264_010660 [Littorina saxatilis]|uniref:Ig-like domain-containing protein n=1 Tax=Littorina saxatilis TaxID=31220 RepID=A0AAN9AQ92_9CAEN